MQERADEDGNEASEGEVDGKSHGVTAADDRESPASIGDLPRVRQQPAAEGSPTRTGAPARGEEGDAASTDLQAARAGAELSSRDADDEVVVGEVADDPQQALVTLFAAALSRSSSWSGLLPPPDDFARYPEHVQHQMMAWNDADTVDESRRQDRLVDAEIDQARVGRWIALGLTAFCFIAAVVFFSLGNEVAGFAFLAAPVLTAGSRFFANVFSRSSRTPPPVETGPPATTPPEVGPGTPPEE